MKYYIKPLIAVGFVLFTISIMAFTLVREHLPTQAELQEKASRTDQPALPGYRITQPNSAIELPEILMEISGLTDLDDQTLACVQDEDGTVFIYDLKSEQIVHQLEFADGGDYEGITRAGNSLFVLRSDGKLFEIDDFRHDDFRVKSFATDMPVKDSEGLAYDATHHRLLIAGKSKPKGDQYKGKKVVYSFDLGTRQLSAGPVLTFDEEKISRTFPAGKEKAGKKEDMDVSINPSAIAVHPFTDQFYVLSSKDHQLFVFSRDGNIEHIQQLDKKMFAQPEGITFLPNGDLFISNEGKKGAPTLLRFAYARP